MVCNLLSPNQSRWLALICLLAWCLDAGAHGGVFLEDDLCVIQIGFFKAHFTIYQPHTRANKEFCEDIPDVTETVFVLDYLHDSLKEMPIDFRIIKDVGNLGRYATWDDIARLDDIDRETVFYRPPVKQPDAIFSVDHTFEQPGHYIGIVTTKHPTKDKIYNAVFPFQVAVTDYGYLPIIVMLVVLVQILYWISSGGLDRWRAKLNKD